MFMRNEYSAYTDDDLKKFDLIVWHKTLFDIEDIRRAKRLSIPTIVDFDDHWVTGREHTMYQQYTKEGQPARLHKLLLVADYVTCTTERLADEIYLHNQNVEVLSNAIDTNYEAMKIDRVEEDKFVFGYLGGPCHTRDVALLRGVASATKQHFRLFGYNKTDIYNFYANILAEGDNYSLFRGANIHDYPRFYNHMDCSLVPLEASKFNSMKSELKLLEAGAFKKAVIVSNVDPYRDLIRHGKNCLAASTKSDWINYIKTLSKNKNIAEDLGQQLHEDTRQYDISVVNKKRFKFYKDVQQKHNTVSSDKLSRMVNVN